MRIGLVTQWPFPNTPDDRCKKIAATLAAAGHDVIVFTAAATDERFIVRGRIVEVRTPRVGDPTAREQVGTTTSPIPANPYWAGWLGFQAWRLRLDCLMSKELRLGLSTYWAAKVLGLTFWIDLAENFPGMVRVERRGQLMMPLHASVAAFLEKRCARAADLVTVVTESNRERLTRQGVSRNRVVVVSNTPVLENIPRRNGTALPGKLNLVYAGMLSKVRGLEQLLKALARMGTRRESIRLHIAGVGSEKEPLRRLSESLELTDCVRFRGWVPKQELSALLLGCDVGVIPHLLTDLTHTTIPNKLFDYMACGLPVWTTSMKPCKDIIDAVGCGWVSDDSVEGMAEVLGCLLGTSDEERRSIGERGRLAVHCSYNWDVDSRRMLDALASLA